MHPPNAKHKPNKGRHRHARKGQEPEMMQPTAYVHLTKTQEAAWWKRMEASEKPPTMEQRSFLQAVAQRCRTEQQELNRWNAPGGSRSSGVLSESVRACLFGDPGAGKSHCIHLRACLFGDPGAGTN